MWAGVGEGYIPILFGHISSSTFDKLINEAAHSCAYTHCVCLGLFSENIFSFLS